MSLLLRANEEITRGALHPLGLHRFFLWKAMTSFLSEIRAVFPEGGLMARVSMGAVAIVSTFPFIS